MDYCRFHNGKPPLVICIAPHICERKLCVECIYQHESLCEKQFVPFETFIQLLKGRLQGYKLLDQTQINQLRLYIKSLQSQTENQIKDLWNSLNKIFEKIEAEEQIYIQLFEQHYSLFEFSQNKLNKLVEIFQGEALQNWNIQKTSYLTVLQSSLNWLEKKVTKFEHKVKIEMKELFSLFQTQKTTKDLQNQEAASEKDLIWVTQNCSVEQII